MGSYPSAEILSVYFIVPADWAENGSRTLEVRNKSMLYTLLNGYAFRHEYTSTSDGVHQSAWHNHVWYHWRSRRIVTTPLDSPLSTNYQLFNQVHLYLVSVTWIYVFFDKTFCVPRVFLWSASQQSISGRWTFERGGCVPTVLLTPCKGHAGQMVAE